MEKPTYAFNRSALSRFFCVQACIPYLGLALAFCWTYSIQRVVPNTIGGLFQIIVFAGTASACIFFAFLSKRRGSNVSSNRTVKAICPIAAALCALLLIVPNPLHYRDPAVLFLGGICGFTIGWLYLLWGDFYSKLDIKPAIAILFGSVIAASALKIGIFAFSSHPAGAALCALLAPASAYCHKKASLKLPEAHCGANRFTPKTLFSLKRMSLGVVAFSFALGVIRSLDLEYFSQPFAFETFTHLLEIAVCIGLVCLVYRRREDLDFSDLWLLVLIAIASGLIAAEYLPGALGSTSFAILTAAQMFALVFLWLGLSDVAHNTSYPSDSVFGIGWSFYALPVAVGSLCAIMPGFHFDRIHLSLVVVYALLIAVVFFLRERTPHEYKLFADLNPPLFGENLSEFSERIERLAMQYSLSEREREIVALYAQGRNRRFISSTLFISENTVRDHIKNVYKKMHIHSKQELIDAIQRMAERA